MALACEPAERAKQSGDAAATESESQRGEIGGAANVPDGQANAGARDASAAPSAMVLADGGAASPLRSDAGNDAGMVSGSQDAATQHPSWEGLVSLDASITRAPDGAVINGGIPHYDAATAGPVLNPQAQTACLTLVSNICNRDADCQASLAQLPASRRSQLIASCQDTWLLNHNCNRAVSTASDFNTCAESVKTADCLTVFSSDFATSCVSKITFQP